MSSEKDRDVEDDNEGRTSALGLIYLALLVIVWIGQSEYSQAIQQGTMSGGDSSNSSSNSTGATYNKPLFISWYNHSMQILAFPLCWMYAALSARARGTAVQWPAEWFSLWIEGVSQRTGRTPFLAWVWCLALATILLVGDWFWYIGLGVASVAESTAIFNSSAAFAYLFSVLLLGDKFTLFGRKTLAVIVSFAGVLIIAIGAHSGGGASSESQRLVGDIYVFLAAALYALYEVLYSVFGLPEPEPSLDEDYDAVLEEGSGSLHNDYDSISQSVGGDEASSPPTFQVGGPAALLPSVPSDTEIAHMSPLIDKRRRDPEDEGSKLLASHGDGVSNIAASNDHENNRDHGHDSVLDPFDVSMVIGMLGALTLLVLWIAIALLAVVSASCPDGGLDAASAVRSNTSDGTNIDPACGSGFFGTAVEPFQLPSSEQWGQLTVNALLAFAFNVLLLLSVEYTSALTTTVGCMTTIPITAIVDFLLWGTDYGIHDIFGAILVVIGFLLLVAGEKRAAACVEMFKTTSG